MSTAVIDVTDPEKPEEARATHTSVHLAYAGASTLVIEDDSARLALYSNLRRDPVRASGAIKDPLQLREALSALYAVVASDFRYVPKDRTAYLAYTRMRRESASLGLWKAQQEYFAWIQRNDPLAFVLLDPVLTVHPDRLLLEVFSKDEGTYASLGIDWKAFDLDGPPAYGTSNLDFTQQFFAAAQQLRKYRPTRLSLGQRQDTPAAPRNGEVLDKKISVPDSWLRGFLQVQSATTFPLDSFRLAPIDLYNVLRHLRLNGDRKGQRRGIRIELVPGEPARIVLEPWEVVIPSTAGMYRGKAARVVRLWGRRRLMLVRRLLPFIESVDVYLMGSGLPSFWVFRAGDITLTLGLTGFTASNWSQALNFDLLLPRKSLGGDGKGGVTPPLRAVLDHLSKTWYADAADLAGATGLKGATLLEALQAGCQQGQLMYDLAAGVYRLRPITDAALDPDRLEFRSQRERVAYDLLMRRGAVRLERENRIPGTGLELTGRVEVEEDRREYRPQMLLADEGQVTKAECTCTFFRKQGLKAGPCTHLIALRLAWADEESRRRKGLDPRQSVTVETRTFSKRDGDREDLIQLSLERQRLKVRWGRAGGSLRLQTLTFNTQEEARAAYFTRLDEADARGYLDATTG